MGVILIIVDTTRYDITAHRSLIMDYTHSIYRDSFPQSLSLGNKKQYQKWFAPDILDHLSV